MTQIEVELGGSVVALSSVGDVLLKYFSVPSPPSGRTCTPP